MAQLRQNYGEKKINEANVLVVRFVVVVRLLGERQIWWCNWMMATTGCGFEGKSRVVPKKLPLTLAVIGCINNIVGTRVKK